MFVDGDFVYVEYMCGMCMVDVLVYICSCFVCGGVVVIDVFDVLVDNGKCDELMFVVVDVVECECVFDLFWIDD